MWYIQLANRELLEMTQFYLTGLCKCPHHNGRLCVIYRKILIIDHMKRVIFLDYIRVIACFLVMLVHASECYYVSPDATMDNPISYISNESNRLWVSIYDGFSRMAVPLFMIVSAYLLAPMPKEQNIWQFYKRRFLRILPPFFFFMVMYSVLPYIFGWTDASVAVNDLSRIILNFPTMAGHLWFMYPLISLYLFIPIISPWLEKSTAREEMFFIILFSVSACMPYLETLFGNIWGQCSWNDFHALWYFSGYLGYLVLAHYIRAHLNWSVLRRVIEGTVMLLLGAIITIMSFYIQASVETVHYIPDLEIGWAFCSINCVLLTTGAFLLFSCINRPFPIVYVVSRFSYGMYLVHMLWLPICFFIFNQKLLLPVWFSIPCIAFASYVCSFLTIRLLSFIPGSKWIIG